MAFATEAGIRDRVIALIAAVTPAQIASDRFRVHRDEAGADFRVSSEATPTNCLRRFQVRTTGEAEDPESTNATEALQRFTLEITVAYPQTHRFGSGAARDRDDAIDSDWWKINYAVGIYGRANFSGVNDCCPMGAKREMDRGPNGVDFLVITAVFQYTRLAAT